MTGVATGQKSHLPDIRAAKTALDSFAHQIIDKPRDEKIETLVGELVDYSHYTFDPKKITKANEFEFYKGMMTFYSVLAEKSELLAKRLIVVHEAHLDRSSHKTVSPIDVQRELERFTEGLLSQNVVLRDGVNAYVREPNEEKLRYFLAGFFAPVLSGDESTPLVTNAPMWMENLKLDHIKNELHEGILEQDERDFLSNVLKICTPPPLAVDLEEALEAKLPDGGAIINALRNIKFASSEQERLEAIDLLEKAPYDAAIFAAVEEVAKRSYPLINSAVERERAAAALATIATKAPPEEAKNLLLTNQNTAVVESAAESAKSTFISIREYADKLIELLINQKKGTGLSASYLKLIKGLGAEAADSILKYLQSNPDSPYFKELSDALHSASPEMVVHLCVLANNNIPLRTALIANADILPPNHIVKALLLQALSKEAFKRDQTTAHLAFKKLTANFESDPDTLKVTKYIIKKSGSLSLELVVDALEYAYRRGQAREKLVDVLIDRVMALRKKEVWAMRGGGILGDKEHKRCLDVLSELRSKFTFIFKVAERLDAPEVIYAYYSKKPSLLKAYTTEMNNKRSEDGTGVIPSFPWRQEEYGQRNDLEEDDTRYYGTLTHAAINALLGSNKPLMTISEFLIGFENNFHPFKPWHYTINIRAIVCSGNMLARIIDREGEHSQQLIEAILSENRVTYSDIHDHAPNLKIHSLERIRTALINGTEDFDPSWIALSRGDFEALCREAVGALHQLARNERTLHQSRGWLKFFMEHADKVPLLATNLEMALDQITTAKINYGNSGPFFTFYFEKIIEKASVDEDTRARLTTKLEAAASSYRN